MIKRAQEVVSAASHEYDLCIVGSGPSGMTVAAELADTGLSICVIESGGEDRNAFSDAMRGLDQSGLVIRDSSRERVLGGSSATWRGLSALYDDCDFAPRPGFGSYEGWPLSPEELEPYLVRAGERYQFPPRELFDAKVFVRDTSPHWRTLQPKVFLANRKAPNFGQEFRNLFARSAIDLLLDSTVVRLSRGHAGEVAAAVCKTTDGREIHIQAKTFVLAAGAIESARILLNSDMGNEHDQVGRYLMNHPKGYRGSIRLAGDPRVLTEYLGVRHGPYSGYLGLRLSDTAQKDENLLNSYVQLMPDFPWSERKEISTVKSFVRWILGRGARPRTGALLAALPQVVRLALARLSYGKTPRPRRLRMRHFLDMEPRADNRVTLSNERDALGVRKARVEHTLSEKDIASWHALIKVLGAEFARLGLGRVELTEKELAAPPGEDASHHMGTTRMGKDPRTSVVDENLRVHTMANLYVTGGSVLPTSGNANPTLTMAALSIRLAEYMRTRVFGVAPTAVGEQKSDVLVVGAGRRVIGDILPVLESLGLSPAFFAPTARLVAGTKRLYDALPLERVTQRDIEAARVLYLSVPPARVPGVLEKVTAFDCSHLTLILPTPVEESSKTYWGSFAQVYAEEDMAFLPWLPLVARATGPLQRIRLDRSAYRYHAVALLRALAGGDAPAHVSRAWKFGNTLHVRVGNVSAIVVEPRDYASGHMQLVGARATVADSAEPGAQTIELVGDNACTAVRIGGTTESLSAQESALFGPRAVDDTVVTRMHDFKRIALRRLLTAALEGKGWSAEDGALDACVDAGARKPPFFYRR